MCTTVQYSSLNAESYNALLNAVLSISFPARDSVHLNVFPCLFVVVAMCTLEQAVVSCAQIGWGTCLVLEIQIGMRLE